MTGVQELLKIKDILIEVINMVSNDGSLKYYPGLDHSLKYIEHLIENPEDLEIIRYLKSGIRTMYGGMGTFQDLVLGGASGRCTPEEIALNKRLSELRHQLYKLVDEL